MDNEIKALASEEANPFGTTDWVKLSLLAADYNCTVIPIIHSGMASASMNFFTILAELTGGTTFSNQARSGDLISRLTLDILLHWMGEPLAEGLGTIVEVVRFEKSCKDANPPLQDEEKNTQGYLPMKGESKNAPETQRLRMTKVERISEVEMGAGPRLLNLGKLFSSPNEAAYRDTVYGTLHELISSNVLALTYNAVFGTVSSLPSGHPEFANPDSRSFGVQCAKTAPMDGAMSSSICSANKSGGRATPLASRC